VLRTVRTFQKAHVLRGQYLAGRLLRRPPRSLFAAASSCTTLAPEETCPYRAPRMRKGHLERMVHGWEDEPLTELIARLLRHEWTHAATELLTLENVALIGPRLYAGRTCVDLDRGRMPKINEVESFDDVILAATWSGSHWFGHFIHDELPVQLLASQLGVAVAQARFPHRDEAAYRTLFRVPAPRVVPGFVARRCGVLVDFAQNQNKRARYAQMRTNAAQALGPPLRVYLRRVGGALRVLREESQLIDRLAQRGFVILDNEHDSVAHIAEVCARACQLITTDGSHAAPAILLAPPGAELIDLVPPDRVTDIMTEIAQSAGLRTALYVGYGGAAGHFSVEVDDLLGFVDE